MKKWLSLSFGLIAATTLAGNAMALEVAKNHNVTLSYADFDTIPAGHLECKPGRYVDLSDKMDSDFEACEYACKWINEAGSSVFNTPNPIFLAEKMTVGNFSCEINATRKLTTAVILSPDRTNKGFDVAGQTRKVLALWAGEVRGSGALYGAITELVFGAQVDYDFTTD